MYHLYFVTPEYVAFDGEVKALIAPGTEGYLEVLTDHIILLTTLQIGNLTIRNASSEKTIWAISGGILEVSDNRATLLADTAEEASRIDKERATRALNRANERLQSGSLQIDRNRAKRALERAKNRLKIARLR